MAKKERKIVEVELVDKRPEGLDKCQECGGGCCKHIALPIDKPTTKTDYDNIRWMLMHKDVIVYVDHDGDWLLEFPTRCENLTEDNSCAIYSHRPRVCKNYPPEDQLCLHDSDEPVHTLIFYNAEEFEAYLESEGTKWKWKWQK